MQSQVVRIGLLIVVPLIIFAQVVTFQFVNWDDPFNIMQNPLLNPPQFSSLLAIWNSSYFGLYIPLTYTFWWVLGGVSHALSLSGPSGFSPGLFHAANLALHIGCVLATYRVLRLVVPEVTPWGACFGALLVAVHPLQVESVAWVTESKGLLSTLFSLLALGDWAVCRRTHMTPVEEGSGRPRAPEVRSTIFFVLALLSKPAAVAVPLVAICIDWLLWRTRLTSAVRNVLDWLVMAVVVVLMTRYVQPTVESVASTTPLWERPLVAADALGFYLAQLFAPWDLTTNYGRTPEWVISTGAAYWMWIVPALFLAGTLWQRNRIPLTGLAIFTVWLLPVLGLVSFQFQAISTVADRYVYPAMLGPALVVAWLTSHYGRPAFVGFGAVLVLFSGLAFTQVRVWRDSVTLFSHALEVRPDSDVAMTNLAAAYLSLGDMDKAAENYRRAIAAGNRAEPRAGLAGLLIDAGELDEAVQLLEEALDINERAEGVHATLARVYRLQGEWRQAREHALKAVGIHAGNTEAITNLVWILATAPEADLRDGAEAVRWGQTAVAQTGGTDAEALAALAAAPAETGDFSAAQQTISQAIEVLRPGSPLETPLLNHQTLYRRGQPVRQKAQH